MSNNKILIDTNVILRSKQKNSLHFNQVIEKLLHLATNDYDLVVCPQIIYEFYVVATRPEGENGFGLSPANAIDEVKNIIETYSFVGDTNEIFSEWIDLIKTFEVSGKNAHDTKLVAFMKANKISKIYTLNISDFKKYSSIIEII